MPPLEVEPGLTSTARSHLSGGIILTLAFGCGLLVANLYFGQPLAAPISASTGLPPSLAGVPVTLTQVGYAIALLLLAPLGDICETRAVVVPIVLIGLLALVAAALSSSPGPFLVASLLIGICPVGGQILLPYAARLAPEHERGHVVGKVMSGLILGIMLSRPMGSFVASVAGWRAIYWLIAAGEAVLAVLLLKVLPSLRPQTSLSYMALLRSLLPIWRNHAELRYRAVIHAGLLAAFILFWTAAPLHLARDFGLGQQAIGLFALAGVSGACVAPFVGRIADAGHRKPRIARAAQLVALTTAVIPFVIVFWSPHMGCGIVGLRGHRSGRSRDRKSDPFAARHLFTRGRHSDESECPLHGVHLSRRCLRLRPRWLGYRHGRMAARGRFRGCFDRR